MKKYILGIFVALGLCVLALQASPTQVSAQFNASKEQACRGVGVDGEGSFIDCNAANSGGDGISGVLATALNILSLVAGVIAVIMIILAGIKYQTSQGESGAIASARSTLIYAIVGIVIVIFSQVIVNFVINEATTTPAPTSEEAEQPEEAEEPEQAEDEDENPADTPPIPDRAT